MAISGQRLIQLMEQLAPKHFAVEHDTIGLQLGTLNKLVERVLVTLDVTEAVVDEAIEKQVDLIIAHHAIIFRPLTKIDIDVPAGRLYEKLIKHNISVYIAHTNLDVGIGGVNDLLASSIGMKPGGKVLEVSYRNHFVKLIVSTPYKASEAVITALKAINAHAVSKYSRMSLNELQPETDVKLEVVFMESELKEAIQALKKAQPDEELDYYTVPIGAKPQEFGLGRVNALTEELSTEIKSLGELAEHVKRTFNLKAVKVVGDLAKPIKKIAVLGGMGAKYVRKAKFAGADVIVTGDIDFHTAQDALADGMAIIDAGHHIEHVMIKGVAVWLTNACDENKYKVEIIESAVNTDPFQII